MIKKITPLASLLVILLGFAHKSSADEFVVGAGGGLTPRFPGSNSYRAVPYASFSYKTDGFSIHSEGPGVLANISPTKAIEFGPVVQVGFGRKGNLNDPVINLLPRVGTSIEIGAYVAGGLPLALIGIHTKSAITARVEILKDVASGHRGTLIENSVGYTDPISEKLKLVGSVSATWADSRYTRAFFGVSQVASARSGLTAYSTRSGFNSAALTGVADYKLGKRWSVISIGRYSRLIGDAANSPIVIERGSVNQFYFGLALKYKIK